MRNRQLTLIAADFNLTRRAVEWHRNNHLKTALIHAHNRQRQRNEDKFADRHEKLNEEAFRYVEDAKKAVKMQRVTIQTPLIKNGEPVLVPYLKDGVPQLTADGQQVMVPVMVAKEVYQEYRDVGAMAPALGVATSINRILGEATGKFVQDPSKSENKPFVIILSRGSDNPRVNPTQSTQLNDSDDSPAQIDDGYTIDITADN